MVVRRDAMSIVIEQAEPEQACRISPDCATAIPVQGGGNIAPLTISVMIQGAQLTTREVEALRPPPLRTGIALPPHPIGPPARTGTRFRD